MTYTEACRVAEECAKWIRDADAERVVKAEQLERAKAVILAKLSTEPAVRLMPDPEPPAAERVVPFVHPDDEAPALDLTNVIRSDEQATGTYYHG